MKVAEVERMLLYAADGEQPVKAGANEDDAAVVTGVRVIHPEKGDPYVLLVVPGTAGGDEERDRAIELLREGSYAVLSEPSGWSWFDWQKRVWNEVAGVRWDTLPKAIRDAVKEGSGA